MLSVTETAWSNWSRAHVCYPKQIFFPENEEQLQEFFQSTPFTKIRIVGSGHSFSPIVPTDTVIISLDKMSGLIDIDRDQNKVEVWAGTKLQLLAQLLSENQMALANMGDIDRQSIAGALCTGTHGTGLDLGILSDCVEEFSVVTPDGTIRRFSDPSEVKLAVVNLGMLGVVTRMKLKVMPEYKLHIIKRKNSLQNVVSKLKESYQNNRHYEFFWFPHSDVVQEYISNETDKAVNEKSNFQSKLDYFLENKVFYLLSSICRSFPASSKKISALCGFFVGGEERVNQSHKIFANDREVKFQEMELAINIEHAEEAILAADKYIKDNDIAVHFPIEVRFTAADEIALSASYQRQTCYMAFHMFEGMPYEDYFRGIQEVLRPYNLRAHWGKMSFFKREEYEQFYPRLKDFVELRREMDPQGKMLNPYLERIFK